MGNSWWVYKSYFWKPGCKTGRHVKWIETCNGSCCSTIHEHNATNSIVLSVQLWFMYSIHESNKRWRCNNEVTFSVLWSWLRVVSKRLSFEFYEFLGETTKKICSLNFLIIVCNYMKVKLNNARHLKMSSFSSKIREQMNGA